MTVKLLLCFTTIALALASAASSHRLTLYQDVSVNGKQLKAGDYKVEVKDGTAVFINGKTTVEAPVKIENGDTKFSSNVVRYGNENGSSAIHEIRLRGTTTKLVFEDTKITGLR